MRCRRTTGLSSILHRLDENGRLSATEEVVVGKRTRNDRATKKGQKLLTEAQAKLKELFREVVEEPGESGTQ